MNGSLVYVCIIANLLRLLHLPAPKTIHAERRERDREREREEKTQREGDREREKERERERSLLC